MVSLEGNAPEGSIGLSGRDENSFGREDDVKSLTGSVTDTSLRISAEDGPFSPVSVVDTGVSVRSGLPESTGLVDGLSCSTRRRDLDSDLELLISVILKRPDIFATYDL